MYMTDVYLDFEFLDSYDCDKMIKNWNVWKGLGAETTSETIRARLRTWRFRDEGICDLEDKTYLYELDGSFDQEEQLWCIKDYLDKQETLTDQKALEDLVECLEDISDLGDLVEYWKDWKDRRARRIRKLAKLKEELEKFSN